jgi:hypothetical protein
MAVKSFTTLALGVAALSFRDTGLLLYGKQEPRLGLVLYSKGKFKES